MIRNYTKILFQIILIALCFCTISVFAEVGHVKWGYIGNSGPGRWGQLDPAFAACSLGKSQSPISLNNNFKTAPYELAIKYQSAPMVIVNDGETRLLIGHTQTIINTGHGIQLNFPQNGPRETITFKGKVYHLVQFHIHTPSETALDNQIFPMEIHFVHQSDDGQILVIAVLGKVGAVNPNLQNIINNFPKDHGIEHLIRNERINPVSLIPSKRDYYSFAGSLTTPPCIEGLQWLVMPNFITVSASQIVLFRKAIGGDNARHLQSRHKREVYFSTE